ncbi:MAG: carotenoid biosynthesis protein [Roseiflexaceae bacterium]
MIRHIFQRLALLLFCIYLAVFPGSTIVVALDRVPRWGAWMGGALLLLQGAAALCWLLGQHGTRGGLAAVLVFLLAWAVEYVGVTSGLPFGRYHYTGALQPQLFGIVPLAIPCAWLMVAAGAWQLSYDLGRMKDERRRTKASVASLRPSSFVLRLIVLNRFDGRLALAATLVLLLDLQIETVATKINQYWIWQDGGPYYGVPTANFVAWWLTGLAMAVVVAIVLGPARRAGEQASGIYAARLVAQVAGQLPAYLYLLSTLMFAIINLAHGYTVAGLIGVIVLLVVGLAARPASVRSTFFQHVEHTKRSD